MNDSFGLKLKDILLTDDSPTPWQNSGKEIYPTSISDGHFRL